ncbi:hypothetical protein ACN4EG_25295 [Alkalinema pantanalense CENA528]
MNFGARLLVGEVFPWGPTVEGQSGNRVAVGQPDYWQVAEKGEAS